MSQRSDRFLSFNDMQIAHEQLLDQRAQLGDAGDQMPTFWQDVIAFVNCTKAIGALLDLTKDRRATQSILDYWANALYRARGQSLDVRLDAFDPALAPELPDTACPYQGLSSFDEGSHEFFFGREALIEEMVERLQQGKRLLFVVGASGSGKSSVVRAGVIPTLKAGALPASERWHYITVVPGAEPLKSLAHALESLAGNPSPYATLFATDAASLKQNLAPSVRPLGDVIDVPVDQPIVLVVDQFEEVFTLCTDEQMRQGFANQLVSLVQTPQPQHRVILTMRTDHFADKLAKLPELYDLFSAARIDVGALGISELRATIEKPAAKVGLKFDEGIIDDMIAKILGEGAGLPLLQFTLLQLWEHRQRNRITKAVYERVGNPLEALGRSAEDFYTSLPENQKTIERILLKMVRPDEGTEVTSQRIPLADLFRDTEARDRIERVLHGLICEARLVKLSGMSIDAYACTDAFKEGRLFDLAAKKQKGGEVVQIEVAHEALIRNWPRLVDWLDKERVNMRQRLSLRAAAREWIRLRKDESALWSGLQLEEALRFKDFDDLEREFVQASIGLRDRQIQEKEAQRAAQLKLQYTQALATEQQKRADDQALANKQLRQVQSWLFVAIAVVFLLAVAAAVLGKQAQKQADIAAAAEIRAQNEAKQAKLNLSQFWTERAQNNVTEQPQGSLLLAAEAVALSTQLQGEPLPQTLQSLQKILPQVGGEPLKTDDNQVVTDATVLLISPDQHWLAAGSNDGAIYLWDLTAAKPLTAVTTTHPHKEAITSMAFSANGHWLATGSRDDTVQLTDINNLTTAAVLLAGHTDDVTTLAFMSIHGHDWLATGSADKTVQLFDLADLDSITAIPLLPQEAGISKVIFSPDGHWLATVTVSDTLRLWNIATIAADKTIPAAQVLSSEKDGLIAFSPNGKWLVAASNTSPNVQLYAMKSPDEHLLGGQLPGQGQGVYALAFDVTEQWLAVGGDDGSVRVWDLATVVSQLQLPQSPEQPPVASPMGERPQIPPSYPMLKVTVRRVLSSHNGAVSALAFAPTNDYLATGGIDHSFQLWRMADQVVDARSSLYPQLKLYGSDGAIETIIWGKALSGDQKRQVFTHSQDGSIRLWEPLAPTLVLQDMTPEELVALACARAGRDFSVQEKAEYFRDNQYVSTCAQINGQSR